MPLPKKCINCDKKFQPTGTYNLLCPECLKEKRKLTGKTHSGKSWRNNERKK